MSCTSASRSVPGKCSGTRDGPNFGSRGSTAIREAGLHGGVPRLPMWPVAQAEKWAVGMPRMPMATESPPLFDFCCFPPASPAFASGAGKQKRPRRAALNRLKILRDFGAGEGIRTLDPNLGKVVR
jgi:hypothetical protein